MTTRHARACQDPDHEGDRLIDHPSDLWEYRTTYYRSDGAKRAHELTELKVCTVCMERRHAALVPAVETTSMF